MRNPESWRPTNIIPDANGQWRPNFEHVAPWSRHATSLECPAYVDVLQRNVSGDLLDVGAGTVPYYGVYKDLASTVTATDWSESSHDTSHIDSIVDANAGLPFAAESFDTVLLADVLEHIKEPQRLMGSVSRVLRPNGKLIVFVPFMYGVHEAPHDYHRYTRYALEDLCTRSGLNVQELEAYGGGPDIVIDLVEKMSHGTKFAKPLELVTKYAILKSGIYTAAQAKYKERFPIGYTMVAQKPTTQDGAE